VGCAGTPSQSLKAGTRAIYTKKMTRTKRRARNVRDMNLKMFEATEKYFIHVPKDVKIIFCFQMKLKKAFCFFTKNKN